MSSPLEALFPIYPIRLIIPSWHHAMWREDREYGDTEEASRQAGSQILLSQGGVGVGQEKGEDPPSSLQLEVLFGTPAVA
jgi:hypothetical protein